MKAQVIGLHGASRWSLTGSSWQAGCDRARKLPWLGDAGATLHIRTSLIAEAQRRVPRAVADARDQEYSWAQIGDLLVVTRASAWQHYGGQAPTNQTPLEPD